MDSPGGRQMSCLHRKIRVNQSNQSNQCSISDNVYYSCSSSPTKKALREKIPEG